MRERTRPEQKKVPPAGSLIESGVVSNSALKGDTLMSGEERLNFFPLSHLKSTLGALSPHLNELLASLSLSPPQLTWRHNPSGRGCYIYTAADASVLPSSPSKLFPPKHNWSRRKFAFQVRPSGRDRAVASSHRTFCLGGRNPRRQRCFPRN